MRVKYVQFLSPDRVDVVLQPGWWARLFGARELLVELRKRDSEKRSGWFSSITDEPVHNLEHGTLIKRALEARPVADTEPMAVPGMHVVQRRTDKEGR
jgi:hypothetical protein